MNYDREKVDGVLEYFLKRVNDLRIQNDYKHANEWLDMLLGALSMYEAFLGQEYTVDDDGTEVRIMLYDRA